MTAAPRRRAHARVSRRGRRRPAVVGLGVVVAVGLVAGVAVAAWLGSGTGDVRIAGATLAAPTDLAVGPSTCASGAATGQSVASWTAATGATGYVVDVARNAAFTDVITSRTATGTTATVSYPTTSSSSTLYVRVRATAATWTSPVSSTVTSPTCVATGIAAPTGLTAPANSCAGVVGLYTATQPLSWTAVPGASGYVADVALDAAFSQIVQTQSVSATTASFTAPVLGGSYPVYLRVKAVSGSLSSSYASTTATVVCPRAATTTTSTPPTTTTTTTAAPSTTTTTTTSTVLTAPSDLTVGAAQCSSAAGTWTANQAVSWSAVPGATRYTVEVSAGASFATVLDSDSTASTTATVSYAVPSGRSTIYFRVRAQSGTATGGWTTTSQTVACR